MCINPSWITNYVQHFAMLYMPIFKPDHYRIASMHCLHLQTLQTLKINLTMNMVTGEEKQPAMLARHCLMNLVICTVY